MQSWWPARGSPGMSPHPLRKPSYDKRRTWRARSGTSHETNPSGQARVMQLRGWLPRLWFITGEIEMNGCAELSLPSIRLSFAWCIYIGSLSLSHLCSALALSPHYLKEHWIFEIEQYINDPVLFVLVCLRVLEWGVRVWGSSYKDQHFPGTPYPAAMISDHSSSSKIFLPPLTFHWAADITVSHYLIILWCSVLAMQCLCCKWKSCQSLLEMKVLHLSTHLLSVRSQSPASMGQWQMKAQ